MKNYLSPKSRAFAVGASVFAAFLVSVSQVARAQGPVAQEPVTSVSTQVGSDESRRDFGVSFFNLSTSAFERDGGGPGRLETYNYLSLEYWVARGHKISLRPAFNYRLAGKDFRGEEKGEEFAWADSYLQYSKSRLPMLPGDIELRAHVRLYVPTSAESQRRQLITRIEPRLHLSKRLHRYFAFGWNGFPAYYVQSHAAYQNPRGFLEGNKQFGYEQWAEASLLITEEISLVQKLGSEQDFFHAFRDGNRKVALRHNEDLIVGTEMKYNTREMTLTGGLGQRHNIRKPRNDYGFYRKQETEYVVTANFRF